MNNNAPHIWEFTLSPKPSQFLQGNRQFGEKSPLHVLDQFSGKQPYLVNAEFLTKRKLEIPMAACLLLDSQLMDGLVKRVNGDTSDDGIEALLNFATVNGWDISGLFYLMEHFAKADDANFKLHAPRRIAALLHILSMNENLYLDTGKIEPNPEAVKHYLNTFKANSIEEAANNWIDSICRRWSRREFRENVEFSEIAIIKMLLIQLFETPKADPLKKLEAFEGFVKAQLGITLARESHLAIHYFCGQAGALLGTQSNSSAEKAFANIGSTAWDIFLLRFPEFFFEGSTSEAILPYAATREHQLAALGNLMSIERIIQPIEGSKVPVVGYNKTGLPVNVQEKLADRPVDELTLSGAVKSEKATVPAGLLEAMRGELRQRLEKP